MRGPILTPYRNGAENGKIKYSHKSSHEASTAYEAGEKCLLRLFIPRSLGAVSLFLRLNKDGEDNYREYKCVFSSIEGRFDLYECVINTRELGKGLYFFDLLCECAFGLIYGSKAGGKICFKDTEGDPFQLTVCEFAYDAPKESLGGVIYHIFVDRFNKGKGCIPHADEVIADFSNGIPEYPEYPGAPLKNNKFYGGTLYGIINKLDYIKSLGVKLIYLSPIFEARSNHKYDTADYMKVDSMFGGDKALKDLIIKAKEKGIGIILDGVFNHTGSDSIYFNKSGTYTSLGAYQSKASQYYGWYDFKSHPDEYVCWWGIEILPRIHPDFAECGNYFVGEGGVIDKYSNLGVCGFRLDVADELSDAFISKIKYRLNENNRQSILYGEVWEDASNKIAYDKRKKYYLGNELDGVMNYPLRRGLIDYIRNKDTSTLEYSLLEVTFNAPKRIRDLQMNILGTHDTERILTVLGGESSLGKSNSYLKDKKMNEIEMEEGIKLLKSAYTIIATLPGVPSVFYGDEAGLEGYSDPFNRMPYPWGRENAELLSHYRTMGRLRNENSVYKDGAFKLISLDKELLVFSRSKGADSFYTVYNNGESDISVSLDGVFYSVTKNKKYSSNAFINLAPGCAEVLKSRQANNILIDRNDI